MPGQANCEKLHWLRLRHACYGGAESRSSRSGAQDGAAAGWTRFAPGVALGTTSCENMARLEMARELNADAMPIV